MSTDATLTRFSRTILVVLAVLALLCGAGAVFSLVQGPRVTDVSADPAAAIRSSGARVVLTANQALETIDPGQVTVSPSADFTVDATGRTVGVRFAAPLDEGTDYTVTVAGARGVGGGASADLTTTITTPTAPVYALRRAVSGDDMIYRVTVGGDDEKVVYTHPHIEDFRQTADGLLVSVVDGDAETGVPQLLLLDADGANAREVPTPGAGFLTALQVSDRGDLVGYTFSNIGVDGGGDHESELFISSLRDLDAAPVPLNVAGEDISVDRWRFVPDSSAVMAMQFGGNLLLVDPLSDDPAVNLGVAIAIDSVTRGSYTALVDRLEGRFRVDLRTGLDTPLVVPDVIGADDTVATVRSLIGDDLLWSVTRRDAAGMPTHTSLLIESGGTTRELVTLPISDPIIDTCVSPSGDRVALTVSPDRVGDAYDLYRQPLPQKVRTYVYRVADGQKLADLAGFDMTWCDVAPF